MKDSSKFNLGWYAFAGVMGFISGASFSISKYYQGRVDAANEIGEKMKDLASEFNKEQTKKEEES